jgi:hypothetical protein
MAITQTLCSSFKRQILLGVQNFSTDTFKMALYSSAANIGADTTVYTSSGEVSGGGYTAGGISLVVNPTPTLSSGVAFVSFNTAVFNAALTARGALIYNTSKADAAVLVLDFGSDKTMSNFTVEFPPATANSAILRIA